MATGTESQCKAWGNSIRNKATEFYDHQISEAGKLRQEAINRGEDPTKVSIAGGIGVIDYVKLIDATVIAKEAALKDANNREAKCLTDAAPDWMTEPQKMADYALAVALLPYVELTHNYASAKIDLNEVYKGRTFGGSSAVIPQVREDVLNALGIKADAAKIIRDPINYVRDSIQNVLNNINIPPIVLPEIRIDWPKLF